MRTAHHTPRASTRPSSKQTVIAAGAHALQLATASGLLRCAVPAALGGCGTLEDLARGATELANRSRAAAWVLWAQRSAIEALVQSSNIAVREHLLPDLLAGELAGALPLSLDARPVIAEEVAGAYLLYGVLDPVPNLQWSGFSLVAPIRRAAHPLEWAVLRGEEDGLRVGIDHEGDTWWGSRAAAVTLNGTFFRMDEWIGGSELLDAMQPVLKTLEASLQAAGLAEAFR
ncbi:acyl-CoA/acyl-ACP dehydrogenase [Variovorax sp. JS1663]|uniref:acyl-CoA/acyl-ACP dehydrogenase n=1 Tax=Variovorax sp. JS1663 TaxID=1851577 RepID=UPI000B654F68|nr:acyl-CoA/acyl-ACP dehydrogenase [Variovorax sp. JS1663]OUM01398.1 hypothetical protein A8M77_16680 [Variovorax sp. JS1663]